MPTTARQRLHLRTHGAFSYNFVPTKNIFAGHRKVTIAPSILDEMDAEDRNDRAAANYFASIAHLSPVARWGALHFTVLAKGDALELYDPADHDVYPCTCTGVFDDLVWVQREGRSPEVADLACLQPESYDDGYEEF